MSAVARLSIPAIFLLSLIPALAFQSDAPVIHVDVRRVLVPVIVTDAKGRPVNGLKATDFHLFEDEVEQPIASFTAAASAAPEEVAAGGAHPAASGATATPPSHTFVICIDALDSAFADSARTRDALTRLFDKEKTAGSQFVLLSIGRQLRVLQPATSDPAAILARLRNPGVGAAFGGGDAAAFRAELDGLKTRMYDFCRQCNCSAARDCDSQAQDLKVSLDGQAAHWALLREQFLAQLKSVVEELAKLPTNRTLILVSDGFSLQPARDYYAVAASFLPKDSRFRTPGPSDLEPGLQAVMKIASAGNVRIDSVDSRGVEQTSIASTGSMDASSPSDRTLPSVIRHTAPPNRGGTLLSEMDRQSGSVEFQNGAAMAQLSEATGGIYYHDGNDLLRQFRSALADGREYYLLTYVPRNHAADGKFRRISVEVSGAKVHVRAKSGYWPE
jgi:VWFA-related protein